MKVEIAPRTLRLAQPLATAHGDIGERELLLLTLTERDGLEGHGEAAPLFSYDGVELERAKAALARHRSVLERSEPGTPGGRLLDACRAADPLPQALAAVDMALWDLAGRRAGKPVAELLTDRPAASVEVNATIGASDRAGAASAAAAAARAGYRCLKLKVGSGDDAGRVAAVRAAAGTEMALRLDANGAFQTVEHAERAIEVLAPAGLELVEEPVHGVEATRALRARVEARIAIDETAAEPGALAAGVADAVCLKLSRCGGIAGLLAAAALVRAGGGEVYVASTLDGPLGVAAALHAACALASRGALAACGLATLELFEEPVASLVPVVDGAMRLPVGAGLGVSSFA